MERDIAIFGMPPETYEVGPEGREDYGTMSNIEFHYLSVAADASALLRQKECGN